jgi:hypothetical protein
LTKDSIVGMVDMDQMTYANETVDDWFDNLGEKLYNKHRYKIGKRRKQWKTAKLYRLGIMYATNIFPEERCIQEGSV